MPGVLLQSVQGVIIGC